MDSFLTFITGFVAGLIIGFPFAPVFKSSQQENLDLQNSDRMLRIGGFVLYSLIFLAFFLVILLKK